MKKIKNVPGNYYDKHNSKNPIVKFLMHNFHKILVLNVAKIKPKTVLDVGCGEGYTTKIMVAKFPKIKFTACDLEQKMVKIARKNLPNSDVFRRSAYSLKFKDSSFDLVVMNEVLEHLEEPSRGIKECRRVAKSFCIFSVPNEPYWRIANMVRLRYLKDFGNTPGHVQNFTKSQFSNMLKKHFKKVVVVNAYLWNFGICTKR